MECRSRPLPTYSYGPPVAHRFEPPRYHASLRHSTSVSRVEADRVSNRLSQLVQLLAFMLQLGATPGTHAAPNSIEQGLTAFQRGDLVQAASRSDEAARAREV